MSLAKTYSQVNMERKMTDLVIDKELVDLDTYKGKWRNLLFRDTGQTYLGGGVYNSAEEASAKYYEVKNLPEKPGNGGRWVPVFRTKCGKRIPTKRIVSHIPIPSGD